MKGDATAAAPEPRWTAEPVFTVWALLSVDGEGRYFAVGLTEPQARFAATLLNEGGLGNIDGLTPRELDDEIWDAVTVTGCSQCGRTVFHIELDSSKRCKECAS